VVFSYDVLTALREKIAAGEKVDVLVMPVAMLDGYVKEGKLKADSQAKFGTVGTDVVVKEGAPRPDISTQEKFRAAMLAASSVVHATPGKTPSGTHMGKVMEQLGIADAMAKKVIHRPALEGGVQLVADGQADIGIYPASEVANVKGVAVVGTLPAGIDLNTVYGGAATADSSAGDAAGAFLKFMAAPENRSVWRRAGFDPPGS
jgi:molybdate transport system substrate-binding protein